MGYNIEVVFNVLKNGSVTELLEDIKNSAEECSCEKFYEDYEFENKVQFQRRHCLMTIIFSRSQLSNMIFFLDTIKKRNGLYVESIYDDDNNFLLYASQYFITQKMDKNMAKNFKTERKKRSYSDDENMILKSISK